MTGQTRRGDWLAASAVERAGAGVPEWKRATRRKKNTAGVFSFLFFSFLSPSVTLMFCLFVFCILLFPLTFFFLLQLLALAVDTQNTSTCFTRSFVAGKLPVNTVASPANASL